MVRIFGDIVHNHRLPGPNGAPYYAIAHGPSTFPVLLKLRWVAQTSDEKQSSLLLVERHHSTHLCVGLLHGPIQSNLDDVFVV